MGRILAECLGDSAGANKQRVRYLEIATIRHFLVDCAQLKADKAGNVLGK